MMYSLFDVEGNAEAIISYTENAMKKEGKTSEEIELYKAEVENSDYPGLVSVSVSMLDELNGMHTRQEVKLIK
ncbi:hypothetical protein POG77_09015 [Lactococcus petauri]|nr:hypothetical protein [Lactococcus petauri]MDC0815805.1 hypothetical protein [Lactococcus petauri]MDC0817848.1 hypothetical protein [Lactococcus petauri]MDC0824443.1 hypothetical protein [Lactococcus petauri]MDC0831082.1 hypothetical protein [Lactococcus petauri]